MDTSNGNGGKSEAQFVVEAFRRGWEVAKPFHHAQSYDFVVRIPGRQWETVQVKTVYLDKQGNGTKVPTVGVRRSLGRQYGEGSFDWLFACSDDKCWLIPFEVVKEKKSQISLASAAYNQYLLDFVPIKPV
jgi:hypothetical protein